MTREDIQALEKIARALNFGGFIDTLEKEKQQKKQRQLQQIEKQRFKDWKQQLSLALPEPYRPAVTSAANIDELQKVLNAYRTSASDINAQRRISARKKPKSHAEEMYIKRKNAFESILPPDKTNYPDKESYNQDYNKYLLAKKMAYGRMKYWGKRLKKPESLPETYQEYRKRKNSVQVTNPIKKRKNSAEDLINQLR